MNKSSESKPVFFEGQKDLAKLIFSPSGPIATLLGGAPDPGFEAGVQRSSEALQRNLANQGIMGSGLAVRANQDFLVRAQQARESNRLETLLNAIQPAGQRSVGGGGGILSLFGL